MSVELVHLGFGGVVAVNRIVAILDPDSAPVKRLIREAKQEKTAIDMTYGRKTRAVLILDSGHVAFAPIKPDTILERIRQARESAENEKK